MHAARAAADAHQLGSGDPSLVTRRRSRRLQCPRRGADGGHSRDGGLGAVLSVLVRHAMLACGLCRMRLVLRLGQLCASAIGCGLFSHSCRQRRRRWDSCRSRSRARWRWLWKWWLRGERPLGERPRLRRQWWKPRWWWLKGRPFAELHDSLECNGRKRAWLCTAIYHIRRAAKRYGAALSPHVGHPTRHGRTVELDERA